MTAISTNQSGTQWRSRSPAAKRVQEIVPDRRWMTAVPSLNIGDVIELVLFDDAVFRAGISAVNCYPNGSVGMTALLEDGVRGTVFLSYCDGQLRASIEVTGGADYYVRYNPETGNHCAIEVDRESSIVRECGDIMIPPANDERAYSPLSGESADLAASAAAPDGYVTVDVMIVYTPAALAYEGNVANMNANIASAMQRANTAHTNSDTQIYLHLVHSGQITYTESGNDNTDLNRLSGTSDGYMDDVHSLRDTCGADFVCLFSVTSEAGGMGWLLNNPSGRPDIAFCLAYIGQTDTGYTVVHEWGHNMGCSHSKTQKIQPWASDDLRSYSAGWQWSDVHSSYQGCCSVMTYEDANDDGVREYQRVGYFSNPNKFYNGKAIGHVADGDNARAMRELKNVYAAYRTPPVTGLPVTNYPYSESFERDYGRWVHDAGTTTWIRNTGSTPSIGTGPSGAADGSYYLFFEAANYAKTALLQASFDFSSLASPEVSWSYHMYGTQINTLYLEASSNGVSWNTEWSLSGNQGDQWVRTNVNLQAYAGIPNVQIRFRYHHGIFGPCADAALDFITVAEGTIVPGNDDDNDGLPNDWEAQYFGGTTNAVAGTDSDGDGFSNFEEYVGGFDPTSKTSFFKTTGFEKNRAGEGFIIQWTAVSGRVYSVESSGGLLNIFQPLDTNMAYPQASYTDTVYRTKQFYKVGVRLAP